MQEGRQHGDPDGHAGRDGREPHRDGGQREHRDVLSGDGEYKIRVRNDEPYTREQYDERLLAWHERFVARKRAERAARRST